MEKVRFEAFNVEELRVLRRACYEAGAAFGDPGYTAAERATLDDLAVEILGELKKKRRPPPSRNRKNPWEKLRRIPKRERLSGCHLRRKLSRSPNRRKSAWCSGRTFWKGQKLHSTPKAPTGAGNKAKGENTQ